MHLRNGGRGERRLLEAREHQRQRAAVGALDLLPRERAGKGRHAVLQLRELVGDVGRQQVAARGDRLAELHEDRAELFEREAQPLAAAHRPAALEPHPWGEKEQEAQRPVEVRGAHVVVQAVLEQHALDLDEPHYDAQLHGAGVRITGCRAARAAARAAPAAGRHPRAAHRRRAGTARPRCAAPDRRSRGRGTRRGWSSVVAAALRAPGVPWRAPLARADARAHRRAAATALPRGRAAAAAPAPELLRHLRVAADRDVAALPLRLRGVTQSASSANGPPLRVASACALVERDGERQPRSRSPAAARCRAPRWRGCGRSSCAHSCRARTERGRPRFTRFSSVAVSMAARGVRRAQER